jgi:serine protease Do
LIETAIRLVGSSFFMLANSISLCASIALLCNWSIAAAQQPAPSDRSAAFEVQRAFTSVAKQVMPSVVTVRGYVRKSSDKDAVASPAQKPSGWVAIEARSVDYEGYQLVSAGSGFFMSQDGDILTALQALKLKDGSLVDLVDIEAQDGARAIAEIVGVEPTLNLAVLHGVVFLNWFQPAAQPLAIGDSEAMEVGEWTLAFGDPAGPQKYFGNGVLAAKPARDCYQELLISAYMQTSMRVPQQAYGGPLVNLRGELVGITIPLEVDASLGIEGANLQEECSYALPSKILTGLYESIRKTRSFKSPWFGFAVMSRAEIAKAKGFEAFQKMNKPKTGGILIESVFSPSPAEAAGVKPGDFLVRFDGKEITAPVEFQRSLYLSGIGHKAKLEFFRDGELLTKEIVIEQRPAEAKPR